MYDMLLGLYCCDAQLCGVDNIALPGFDHDSSFYQSLDDYREHGFDDHNEHSFDKSAEHIFNDRINAIFDEYAEHYWDHRLVE
ncbi:hypothetical protein BM221_000029 [Beauveria bassiana]|uniref:Uncharacterized protein n=1 Tax=Beauveria bassiana TaxID=176275 RepID=A0A2N6NZB7_BEABA|nr:hypothetical protein BM221_000029 [Beauveria bassiana]